METFSTSNNKNYRKSVFENIADSTKEKVREKLFIIDT